MKFIAKGKFQLTITINIIIVEAKCNQHKSESLNIISEWVRGSFFNEKRGERMMFTRNFIPPSSLFIMCNVSRFLHTYIPSYVSKYLSGRKQVTTCEQEKRARKKRETFLIRYHLSWKNLFLFASFFLHKTPRDAKKENKLFSLIQIRSELIFRKENIYLLYH